MSTRHYESSSLVEAPAERVFAHLDDHSRLSEHMSKSSWMMGGGSMSTEVDERGGRTVGSRIRLAGTVCGVALSVEEIVTEHRPPHAKTWETIGTPRLLVVGAYRMGFELTPRPQRQRRGVAAAACVHRLRVAERPGGRLTRQIARRLLREVVHAADGEGCRQVLRCGRVYPAPSANNVTSIKRPS